MKKIAGLVVMLALVFSVSLAVLAADDPSIPEATKDKVKAAMKDYIDQETTIKGKFYLPDHVEGKILALDFGYVHSGVVKADGGYLACVDFTAGADVYDIDFIVHEHDGVFEVRDAVVHSVNKVKRANHLEGIVEKKGSAPEKKGSAPEPKGSY